MKKAYQLSLALISATLFQPVFANFDVLSWHPGIGIEAGLMNQDFDAGYGDEHFKQDYPYTNAFFNLRFHRYFGVEVGYQNQYNRQRFQWYDSLQPALGFVNTGDLEQKLFLSEVNGRGWNLSLLGFLPICPALGTELMGVAGVTWLKMNYVTTVIENNAEANPLASFDNGHKALVKLGGGIRQPITQHFGARVLAFWQNTSKLDAVFAVPTGHGGPVVPTLASDFYTVKPKNSFVASVGFYYEV